MNLGSVPTASVGSTVLNATIPPGGKPGMQAWSRDGRRFRLVKITSATDIGAGRTLQGPAPNLGHVGLTPTAAVPRDGRTIRVTAGGGAGTNAPANTYLGGLVYLSAGPATGVSYAIKGHNAIVAAQPFTIDLETDDPVSFPIAVTDQISLIANPYLEASLSPGTAATAGVIGVAAGSGISAGLWGWIQVEGLVICAADGAIAIGQAVSPSVTTPGLVTINTGTLPIIGSAVSPGLAAGTVVVSLNLP